MSYLYKTISFDGFRDAFSNMGRGDQFSYEAQEALYCYMISLAEDSGEPIELDVIALCCAFTEYTSLDEYNADNEDDAENWEALDDLECLVGETGALIRNS